MLARFYTNSGDAQATTRCVVPARVLPAEVVAGGSALAKGLPSVWQNPVQPHLVDIIADKQLGNRVVIDVDDPYHLTEEGWNAKDTAAHIEALAHADTLICTTEALAASYEGLHPDIRVIPSCVDAADFQLGRMTQHLDGKFRIGYAAGFSHARDTELIAKALALMSARPDVIVEFVGAFDPGWDFAYTRYPALPHPAYKALIATWNIGLAPLVDHPVNELRSDLKVLDYAASFVVPIVSPFGPYEHLVEKGLVASAESDEEWIEALVELTDNDALRKQLALNLFNYCRVERHPANQRLRYLDALGLRRSYAHV